LLFSLLRTFTNIQHNLDNEIPEIDLKRLEICLVLHIPVNLSGIYEKAVLKAHGRSGICLFWYLNDRYLGETVEVHSLAVDLAQNEYRLIVQDEDGGKASVRFSVYRREGGKESD
jgi:hypothetical protein